MTQTPTADPNDRTVYLLVTGDAGPQSEIDTMTAYERREDAETFMLSGEHIIDLSYRDFVKNYADDYKLYLFRDDGFTSWITL